MIKDEHILVSTSDTFKRGFAQECRRRGIGEKVAAELYDIALTREALAKSPDFEEAFLMNIQDIHT
jgi:hypothetical protein